MKPFGGKEGESRLRNARDNDEETSENRQRIYEFIKNNPGAHLRMICRELELAMGATQHHLAILEQSGRIKSKRINLYRHYYASEVLDVQHALLAFLRQESARDILLYLIEHPNSTQSDIANFKNFSLPTISWHMSRLVESRIVSTRKEGKIIKYSVIDVKSVAALVRVYHPNIWDKLTDSLAEMFLELASRTEEKDKE